MTILSIADRVLLAASDLDKLSSPFAEASLVVEAWRQFPRHFGLKGYADLYPDSNRVGTCLCGERGLVRRGYLYRVSSGNYSLTAAGRRKVRQLRQEQTDRIAGHREELLARRA